MGSRPPHRPDRHGCIGSLIFPPGPGTAWCGHPNWGRAPGPGRPGGAPLRQPWPIPGPGRQGGCPPPPRCPPDTGNRRRPRPPVSPGEGPPSPGRGGQRPQGWETGPPDPGSRDWPNTVDKGLHSRDRAGPTGTSGRPDGPDGSGQIASLSFPWHSGSPGGPGGTPRQCTGPIPRSGEPECDSLAGGLGEGTGPTPPGAPPPER